MKFYITAVKPGQPGNERFIYDNEESTLTSEDGVPVAIVEPEEYKPVQVVAQESPGKKHDIRVLKISLGMQCNYECSYCSQRFVPGGDPTNPDSVDGFIEQMQKAGIDPERVEFWGGEPFVYWKTLKPLAERLRQLFPTARFNIITNGSLLDTEKNAWLDTLGFSVGISHDGPGYSSRGIDPLDDPAQREAIMDLYKRLHPQQRISINAVMHANNRSRAAVQRWLQERFGEDVVIGEGAFIDAYDEGGMQSSMHSAKDHIEYRQRAFDEIRHGAAARFTVVSQKMQSFIKSITTARPAASVGQKCGMDRPDTLVVDLNGNAVTCQNVTANAIAPNGNPHKIGALSDLAAIEMRSATHWSRRDDCASCPVLHLCHGSCMFLEGELWESSCDSAYSDNVPYFAAAIEFLTGFVPVYIQGDFREDRKDIFGQINGIPDEPTARKTIPIKAV